MVAGKAGGQAQRGAAERHPNADTKLTPCGKQRRAPANTKAGKVSHAYCNARLKGAKVVGRSLKREITSRGYIYLIKALAWSHLSDYQCGFKAISKKAALELLPLVEDVTWFFDSELLLLAEKAGYRIYEEPVHWEDDPGTTVNVYTTARDDLMGLARVMRERPWRKLKGE